MTVLAKDIERALEAQENEKQRDHLMRFFKTGKGQYGEGDRFLGLKVPQVRDVVKSVRLKVSPEEIEKLLYSPWHEVRLCGFLLLVEEMKVNMPKKRDSADVSGRKESNRKRLAYFYLRHARQANNWDLVDLSCEFVLGPYIRLSREPDFEILYRLAGSDDLWEQRIAIVSTLDFIRNGIFEPTFHVCEMLLSHPHDLIHKATGWMLRETGKRDKSILEAFLEKHYRQMARTTLRYAIEKMPEAQRQFWLKRE